jgi:hypothetical protein
MTGTSFSQNREVEINNKSASPLCSIEEVNPRNLVMKGADTERFKINVKAGERKLETLQLAIGQERVLRFMDCSGKVVKEQTLTVAMANERLHFDVP